MMRDSKSNGKKPIQEVQTPRPRKQKLERVSRKSPKCKRAEEALLSERNKLISILEAMADGVYIANQKYDIEYVNPVLEKDFGSWKGRKCYEYFHDRKESCSWCRNKDVFAGKTVRWEWYSSKNQRTYDLVDTPLKNTDGSISKLQILRDITDRKRAEEALKASELRFRSLIEQTTDAVFCYELRFRSLIEQTTDAVFCYEYDPPIPTDLPTGEQVKLLYNGLLVECNDVCAKSYGAQRAEEVIGRRLTELFKTMPGSLDKLFTALIDGGYRIVDGEGVEKLEDGTERYYLNNGYAVIEDSKLIRVWGTFRDITERKQMDERVARSEELFSKAFYANPVPATITTVSNDKLLKVNNAWIKLIGFDSQEEAIGKSALELGLWAEVTDREERNVNLQQRGSSGSQEIRVRALSGRIRDCIYTAEMIDYEGQPHILSMAIDITDRKRTEEALKNAKAFTDTALDSQLDTFFLFDPETGKAIRWNKAFNYIAGYSDDEIAELSAPSAYYSKEDLQRAIPFIDKVLKEGTGTIELGLICKNGRVVPTEYVVATVNDAQGKPKYFISIGRDITERKKAEDALQYRLRFEKLITTISTDFVDLRPEEVDEGINGALKALGEFVGIDRSYVFLYRDNASKMDNTHEWCREGIEPHIHRLQDLCVDDFYMAREVLKKGEFLQASCLDDLPPQALTDRREFVAEGIQSLICIPLICGESHVGFMGFDSVRKKKTWSQDEVAILKVVGEMLANALDRKQSEEVLRKSEANYRLIFDTANDAIFIHDTESGKILSFNQKACEMFGYPREEMERLTVEDLSTGVPPYDQEHAVGWIKRAVREGPQLFEWIARHKNGQDIWIEVNLKLAVMEGEDRMLAIVRDITERKQVEEKLKSSEERLKILFEAAPDGIYLNDLEGRFVDGNRAAEELTGYKREELIGKSFLEAGLLSEEQIPIAVRSLNKVAHGQPTGPDEYTLKRKDKSQIVVEIRAFPVRIGTETLSLGIARDISARRNVEESLKESEAKYRSLVTNIPDVVWTTDEKGNTTFISENIESVYGYTPEEIYTKGGKLWFGRIHPDDLEKVKDSFKSVFEKGKQLDLEYRIRRKDGEWIWIQDRSIGAYEKGGVKYADGIFSDITERKKAESALHQYSHIVSSSTDMLALLSTEYIYKAVNTAYVQAFNLTSEQLVGHSVTEVFGEEFFNTVIKPNADRCLAGEEVNYQAWFNFPVRGKRFMNITYYPYIDVDNRIQGFVVNGRDITDRKKTEKELTRLIAILENTSDMVSTAMPNGQLTYINTAGRKLLGWSDDEAITDKMIFDTHPQWASKLIETEGVPGAIRDGLWSGETALLNRDGKEIPISQVIMSHKSPDGQLQYLSTIIRDITERKQAEETLQESEERFRSLSESSPMGVFHTDKEGRVLYTNKRW
ncbi:MAG: PAS domain S-box protein, partial [Planctomycetota bacterium]